MTAPKVNVSESYEHIEREVYSKSPVQESQVVLLTFRTYFKVCSPQLLFGGGLRNTGCLHMGLLLSVIVCEYYF